MPQLIVTAQRLNKRKVIPAVLPDPTNIAGNVFLNDSFEGEEVATVPNPALGKWYVDRDGYFYWGGGVKEGLLLESVHIKELTEAKEAVPTFPWWLKNNIYSIPDLWIDEPPQEINIAILDTGINEHVDFDFAKIKGFNYLDKTINFKTDLNGHGTHLAGIIAAKGIKSFGITPSANLFIAKVSDDDGSPRLESVRDALNDIYNNTNGAINIDVVNMSFKLAARDSVEGEKKQLEDILDLIKKIAKNGKTIFVAACGDLNKIKEYIPASMEECISVGSINSDFKRDTLSTRSTTLDIMAPGSNISSSFNKDSTIIKSGTSQSAAFISAICARAVQEMKSKGQVNIPLLKKLLFQTAINNSFNLIEYGHGIIDPNSFLKSIKSL